MYRQGISAEVSWHPWPSGRYEENGSRTMVDFIDDSRRFPVLYNICVEIIKCRVSGRGWVFHNEVQTGLINRGRARFQFNISPG